MDTENKMYEYDKFWFDDISILFNVKKLQHFFPSNDMSLNEILNSLVRLSFYLSIIFILFRKNVNYIFITVFTLIFTYLIYINLSKEDKKKYENFEDLQLFKKDDYIKPTNDNPFMNVLPEDYDNNPNRVAENEAELYNESKYDEIQENVDDKFGNNLFTDMTDIYNNRNSQRQYYTMPNTQIPNDQTSFAKWCYATPSTCKEGNNLQCFNNLDPIMGNSTDRSPSANVHPNGTG